MNGTRRASKWSELYTSQESEAMKLYATAETHPHNLEEAPTHPDWPWVTCNWEDRSRRGSGVGVLWHKNTLWVNLSPPNYIEHL